MAGLNKFVTLFLVALLLVSLYIIIPLFAPASQQDEIKEWLGLAFSGFMLVLNILATNFSDQTYLSIFAFYLIVLGVVLAGVYWWIPTYVQPTKQTSATHTLFISTSIVIFITNMITNPRINPLAKYISR